VDARAGPRLAVVAATLSMSIGGRDRPGTLLIGHASEAAIAEGRREFHFLRGLLSHETHVTTLPTDGKA
jgi:hypothetical protein